MSIRLAKRSHLRIFCEIQRHFIRKSDFYNTYINILIIDSLHSCFIFYNIFSTVYSFKVEQVLRSNELLQYDGSIIASDAKVVVYHTGALGDLLVATAALFEITNLYPKSEITLVGCNLWQEIILPLNWGTIRSIVVTNKQFTDFKVYKPDEQGLNWVLEKQKQSSSFRKFLAKFTISIDLRSESLRFAYQALMARIPFRVGASKSKLARVFFTHFTFLEKKTEIHERDRYLNILLSLNKIYIEKRVLYWKQHGLPPLVWFPNEHSKPDNKKYILINPTASIREKAWHSARFRELAIKLKEDYCDIKIIGSPKETDWLFEVAQNDFEILQPKTIMELVSIVHAADLLITNTSSMQFIAAGTNTPTLTLMGSASPERWGSLGEGSSCIKSSECHLQVRNILKSKKELAKENERNAYNNIHVNLVLEAVNKVL